MQDARLDESSDREDGNSEPPDGLWITDPPFILPPGIKHCPSPTCPAHSRTFRPYWRLNEHMKLRHGWPRKQTQPHLDKRLGNRFGGRRTKKSTRIIQPSDDEESDDESEGKSTMLLESAPVQSKASLHRGDFQGMSSDLTPRLGDSTPDEARHSLNLSEKKSSNMHRLASIPNSLTSEETEAVMTPDSQSRTAASSLQDETMIAEFEKYIRELEQDISRSTSSLASPELTESRKEMVAGLKNILNQSLARVNTVVPAHQARTISPYYRALAVRASFAWSGQRSVPSLALTSPTTRSLEQPLLPLLHFKSPPSGPTAEAVPQPKPKIKLVLKMTPSQGYLDKSTITT